MHLASGYRGTLGVAAFVVGTALMGCATDPHPSLGLAGRWTGAVDAFTYDCTLSESGKATPYALAGSCYEIQVGSQIILTASGSRDSAAVSLHLVASGRDLMFVGTVNSDGSQIHGTLTGAKPTALDLYLTRAPAL
jgi:hypothetical protein